MQKLSLVVLCFILFTSCKKNENNNSVVINKNSCVVYTDALDIRLAEIHTDDDQKIIFFGERNPDGSPAKLLGYTISSLNDSTNFDIVNLDSLGRYSNFFLRTGEKMHINYFSNNDSVLISLSGQDSVSNQIVAKISKVPYLNIGIGNTPSRVNAPLRVTGADKNVNIKVTTKNTFDQSEEDAKSSDISVNVNIQDGPNHNYFLMPEYNSAKGIYSVPLSSAGFTFNDPGAIDKTLVLIKTTLDAACATTKSGSIVVDRSIGEIIKQTVCVLAGPEALAICNASKALIIACYANTAYNILAKVGSATYAIDPDSRPISTNAKVFATSDHYRYGRVTSLPVTVNQILSNKDPYDIKLTHNFLMPPPTTLSVPATAVWLPSSVIVKQGDKLAITASGLWAHGATNLYGPDGTTSIAGAGSWLPNANLGELIGKIGNNSPFTLGSNTLILSPDNGILQFMMNDAVGRSNDNQGQVTVKVSVN